MSFSLQQTFVQYAGWLEGAPAACHIPMSSCWVRRMICEWNRRFVYKNIVVFSHTHRFRHFFTISFSLWLHLSTLSPVKIQAASLFLTSFLDSTKASSLIIVYRNLQPNLHPFSRICTNIVLSWFRTNKRSVWKLKRYYKGQYNKVLPTFRVKVTLPLSLLQAQTARNCVWSGRFDAFPCRPCFGKLFW